MNQINPVNLDCLLKIFRNIYDFNDLINLLYVCKSWHLAVKERFRTTRYLTSCGTDVEGLELPPDTIDLNSDDIMNEYEDDEIFNDPTHRFTLKYLGSHLTPNIRIISLRLFYQSFAWNQTLLAHFHRATSTLEKITSSEHLGVALIHDDRANNLESYKVNMFQYLDNSPNNRGYFNFAAGNLKQLECDTPIFNKYAHNLRNLRVLNIELEIECQTTRVEPIPSFPNLEILIIKLVPSDYPMRIDLIRQCPRLKSIYLSYIDEPFTLDKNDIQEIDKFPNVEDLVINLEDEEIKSDNFVLFIDFLRLFPNVKHFAIRWFSLTDDHIKQLVQLFPQLAILDLRYCSLMPCSKTELINNGNRISGTNIRVILDGNLDTSMSRSTFILRGTSFMDTYFYRLPDRFPHFVDYPF